KGGQRRRAHGRRVEIERLRPGDADGNGVVVTRKREIPKQRLELRDREVEIGAPVAEIRAQSDGANHQLTNFTTHSIQRVGSTTPCDGSSTSARRPRRSVRPARACSKKRFCSSTSPRITASIFAWRVLVMC